MFEAEKGMFYFVFANDEFYYTTTLLRMDALSYIQYRVLEDGYRYIYCLGKNNDVYYLETVGNWGRRLLDIQGKKKHGLLSFGKNKVSNEDGFVYDRNRMELSAAYVEEMFLKIMDVFRKFTRVALVVKDEVFQEIYENAALRDNICQLKRKQSGGNVMIIQSDIKQEFSDRYFLNPAYIFDNKMNESAASFVFDSLLFPEIAKVYAQRYGKQKGEDQDHMMEFHYDLAKEAMGERMIFLNEMSYEALLDIVTYQMIRSECSQYRDCREYAAFYYAWYNSEEFCRRFMGRGISINLARKRSVIEEEIVNEKIIAAINQIISQEKLSDKRSAEQKYQMNEHRPGIVSNQNGRKFKEQVLRMIELMETMKLTDVEDIDKLYKGADYLERPFYVSRGNDHEMTMFTLVNNDNRQFVIDCIDYLMLKCRNTWNEWDKFLFRILYHIFDMCIQEMWLLCEEDSYHYLGSVKLDKGLEFARICMNKAKSGEDEEKHESAEEFLELFVSATKRADYNMIKKYKTNLLEK